MTPIQFGFCVPLFASPGWNLFRTPGFAELNAAKMMAISVRADELGFDSLWVADHLMLGKDEAIFEGWTVISALAGATSRAKLGMIHQAVFFRNPALAAKMSATLDHLSGGRLIHFLDCGFNGREHVSYGLPWDENAETRVAQLADATELILKLWSADGPVTHDGPFYQVKNAVCAPRPVQQPFPPIWFGEARPDVLDLCAKYGQGWNTTPVSIAELRNRLALLRKACDRADRPFEEIELVLETQILVAPDIAALRARLAELLELARSQGQANPPLDAVTAAADFNAFMDGSTDEIPKYLAEEWIVGTPDQVEQRLRDYAAEGISHFMLWFMDAPVAAGLELFASDIMPRLR